MNRHLTFVIVAVVAGAASVFTHAEEETRKSEINTFKSAQQNRDYRVSLLGITKGIAFVDSQALIDDGGRAPGNNAVPWMRVVAVIEKLTDKDESWGFNAETVEGKALVGKVRIESNGRVVGSHSSGIAEMDCNSPRLRAATFPVGLPQDLNEQQSKVYSFTLSGKFQPAETVVLRFTFGDSKNRRELVFHDVPLP
ncbi:hypothetical protein Enr10x_36710 [Gimesia panareensis]|uniref:Uncharacterized protein n=1 Tax=Gimesia panareensis TaxID=2527978 RepID=A0A517Q9L8_9PLAN|nr:hypothetical protein [Gimesia panareensis]QDT28329.1 hypothetical protein Enr10x_36710 [Gimesia panareensis]